MHQTTATKKVAAEHDYSSPVGRVPAKFLVRMGKAATIGYGINWTTLAIIGSFHVGALAAFFFFSWQRLAVMAILYVLAINVGIGMCYHRLLTHRGYQTPKWVEYIMSIFATMSLEGGPIFWVSTHRVHHQLSDQEGDPHTPARRRLVGAHRLDPFRRGSARAGRNSEALFARSEPRQVPRLAQQVSLAPHHRQRLAAAGRWLDLGRMGQRRRHGAVGCGAARDARPARHLAGELGHAPVGQPAL